MHGFIWFGNQIIAHACRLGEFNLAGDRVALLTVTALDAGQLELLSVKLLQVV